MFLFLKFLSYDLLFLPSFCFFQCLFAGSIFQSSDSFSNED